MNIHPHMDTINMKVCKSLEGTKSAAKGVFYWQWFERDEKNVLF